MKTSTRKTKSHFKKILLYAIVLLGSLTFSSYKSKACTTSFTYSAGVNGHYTFTSTGFSAIWYYWDPGDGSGWHNGSSSFNYTYLANGTYHARLYAIDSTCADTSTIDTIVVSNVTIPCTLHASFNVTYGAGGQVTFTSTSTGTNVNTFYYWSPGDSNKRYQGSASFMHTYLWDGRYGVWLTIEDTGNAYCIDSTWVQITVTNADSSNCHLHANFSYTLDSNGTVTFTSTSTGMNFFENYQWNFGDTTTGSSGWWDSIVTHTYQYNGTYYVTLWLNSDSSLCRDSVTIPITITTACNLNVNFTVQYDTNGKVVFTSTSTGVNTGAQYGWSFGDNTSINGYDTATHDYSFIGVYNVTLTIVNPGGCTASYTQNVYVSNKDSLQARFVYRADTNNTGTYYFTSTSLGTNGNTYYRWTPGDGDPADSGIGMMTYTHTYTINGPDSANLTIWYTVLPLVKGHSPLGRYDESSYTLVIHVVISGVKTVINDGNTYTIYPNPNNGSFRIAINGLESEKNAQIRISNMIGQVVYQADEAVTGGNTLSNISMPNVSNGIYLLQIITNGNTYNSRIAIQR
jgi:PKD repeat protein